MNFYPRIIFFQEAPSHQGERGIPTSSTFAMLAFALSLALGCHIKAVVGSKATHQDSGNAAPMGPFPQEIIDSFFNVRDYGAAGDGKTDDTTSIQAAIQAAIKEAAIQADLLYSRGSPIQVVYFPNGIYKVSDTLKVYLKDNANTPVFTILLGETRSKSIIYLKNNTFVDNQEKPVVAFYDVAKKEEHGNTLNWNSVFRLTVDVGEGNSGAVGLAYHNNQTGRIEDVSIRSSDRWGRGKKGLTIDKASAGIGIITHLHVEGFDYGIYVSDDLIDYAFEHIELKDQRVAGMRIERKPVQIRDLFSQQSQKDVPAILHTHSEGNLIIIESRLEGNSTSTSAIVNEAGQLFVRDVHTKGYASAITDQQKKINHNDIDEYLHDKCHSLFNPSPCKSLNLTLPDVPDVPWDDFSSAKVTTSYGFNQGDWAVVFSPGAETDATRRIQDAIDSGKSTVFLKHGSYQVTDTIFLRGNVRRFHGGWSEFRPVTTMWSQAKPLLKVETGKHEVTVVQCFVRRNGSTTGDKLTGIMHASKKTLVVKDVRIAKANVLESSSSAGPLYVQSISGENSQDIDASGLNIKSRNVTMRAINLHNYSPHIDYMSDKQGKMVVFGFKVGNEHGPYWRFSGGGQVELLGGLLNSQEAGEHQDEILIYDSIVSIIGVAERMNGDSTPHPNVVLEQLDGETRVLKHSKFGGPLPIRGSGAVNISMFRSGIVP